MYGYVWVWVCMGMGMYCVNLIVYYYINNSPSSGFHLVESSSGCCLKEMDDFNIGGGSKPCLKFAYIKDSFVDELDRCITKTINGFKLLPCAKEITTQLFKFENEFITSMDAGSKSYLHINVSTKLLGAKGFKAHMFTKVYAGNFGIPTGKKS